MEEAMNFDAIKFNPETQELTISLEGQPIVTPFNLNETAVKLQVVNRDEELKVQIEAGEVGSFNSDKFEIKDRFQGDGHNVNLVFGLLEKNITVNLGEEEYLIGRTGMYYSFFIGADDIRNNLISPSIPFQMERKIVSFQIENSIMSVQYHDSINPD